MGQILLDDALIVRLQDDAKAHGIDPETRAAQIIEQALTHHNKHIEFLRVVDRIAAMTPPDVVQTPSEVLVREMRDQ
jgi:hypothetical protein